MQNISAILNELDSPWITYTHPAYERYNRRTVRYDWLAQNLFGSLEELPHGATAWLWTYNNERPNMALGGIIPRQKLAGKYSTDSTAARC